MRAIVQREFGPPGVLVAEETDDPWPGPGQVRIRVAAAGVHLADTKLREGQAAGPMPRAELPTIPGREVAGTVDALGDGVDASWLGARVSAHLGATGAGGYAELAVTGAEALHRLPDHVTEADAVAVLGTGRMTMGVLALAHAAPDDLALVTSAAGGIGTLLVQALHAAGTDVIAAAGGADRAARGLAYGAIAAADYTRPDWDTRLLDELGGRRPTLVFDGVGGAVGRAAYDLLAPGGRTLVYGWSSGEPAPLPEGPDERGRTVVASVGPPIVELGLRLLADRALDALADGTFAPVTTSFPLNEAAEAHRALVQRRTVGKVVLTPVPAGGTAAGSARRR